MSERHPWKTVAFIGALCAVIMGSAIVSTALARDGGWWHGRGHRHGHGHEAPTPEAMRARAEHGVDFVMRFAHASDEQTAAAQVIAVDLVDALWPLREAHEANAERIREILTADTIDRDALGQLRATEIDLIRDASESLTTALADLAEVLTPEQRRELADLGRRFRE